MSGLVWGAIGKGVSDFGTTVGSYAAKAALEDEKQQDRLERQRLAQSGKADMAMLAAALKGGGGGKSDSGVAPKTVYGDDDELMFTAQEAGMTVPEIRAIDNYTRTGDSSAFKKKTDVYADVDNGDPYNIDSIKLATEDRLPPGFDEEIAAKTKTLARIREARIYGDKYDDVAKGRRTMQEVDLADDVLSGKRDPGVVGTAMLASGGKELYKGDSNVTRNVATGKTDVTRVGESQIVENTAQAGAYRALGFKRTEEGKNAGAPDAGKPPTTADIQRQINVSENELAESLGVGKKYLNETMARLQKKAAAGDERAKAKLAEIEPLVSSLASSRERMKAFQGKDTPPAAPTPAAPRPAAAASAAVPGGKKDYSKLWK